jgi:hypothetical protein
MRARVSPGWLAGLGLLVAAAGAAGAAGRGVTVTYTAPPGGKGGLEGTVKIYGNCLAPLNLQAMQQVLDLLG